MCPYLGPDELEADDVCHHGIGFDEYCEDCEDEEPPEPTFSEYIHNGVLMGRDEE